MKDIVADFKSTHRVCDEKVLLEHHTLSLSLIVSNCYNLCSTCWASNSFKVSLLPSPPTPLDPKT